MNEEKYEVSLEINTDKFNKQCNKIEDRASRVAKEVENFFKENKIELFTDVPQGDEKHLKELQDKYLNLMGQLGDWNETRNKKSLYASKLYDTLSKTYNQNLDFIEQGLEKLGGQAEETAEDIEEVEEAVEKVGEGTKNKFALFFNVMEKGFEKGFKKVKRFTLGLLGVRGAYFAMNKAMGQYLQNDQELSDKMQSIWTGLGVIIAPIVEYVADLTLKLTKYVLYIANAITGIDLLQRAIDKTDKKMNKSLSSLDEITNVAEQSNLVTLADMLDKTEINTEWADKLAKAIKPVYDFIKKIVDFSIDHPEVIAIILGGWAITSLIGSIIGAGTTGLVGIAVALGIIAGISLAKIIGDMHNLYKETKAYLDLVNGNTEKDQELNNKIKERQSKGELLPGSKDAEKLTTQTRNNIDTILKQIDTAEKQKKWYNFWRWDEIDKQISGLQTELQSAYDRIELLSGKKVNIEFDIMMNYKKVPGALTGGFRSYDVGTNYVPNDQLAMVHEGEAIVPKKFNNKEFFGNNDSETKDMLFEIIDLLRENSDKVPVFNMDSREFAKATYQAYQNEGKRLGVNTSIERS